MGAIGLPLPSCCCACARVLQLTLALTHHSHMLYLALSLCFRMRQIKSGAVMAGDTLTDALAGMEKSLQGDNNAGHFFEETGHALGDTWGDFKTSVVPVYDIMDISWMSLKIFVANDLPKSVAAIPKVQCVDTGTNGVRP